MATQISRIEGDYVIFTYNLDHAFPISTVFELEYHRYHDTGVSDKMDPQVAVGTGPFVTPIAQRFTLPAQVKTFRVRISLDKTVFKVDDTGVWLRVKPLNNKQYFTNPEGGIAILEFTSADLRARMTTAHPQPQLVDEGFTVTTVVNLAPATFAQTTVKLALVHGTTTATDIDYFQYSVNGTAWPAVPAGGVITLPFASNSFFVRVKTKDDFFQEGNETFQVVVTKEPGLPDVIRTDTLTLNYRITDKTVLPEGALIRQYCQGVDLWGEYANGMGGSYDQLIEAKNKPICGYVPPAAGTKLLEFCAGYHKFGHFADGNDGYYVQAIAYNSVDCGFEIGIPNDQDVLTPTAFDPANKGATVVLSDGNRMFFGNRRDAARSVYSTLFGKWYYEYEIYIPHDSAESIAVGIATAAHSLGSWVGATSTSWGWWPHTLTKHHNDIQGLYGLTVHDGDVVSVLLDMMTMKLELWLNGVSMGEMYASLPDVPVYAVINANEESYARANFGDLAFKYAVPAGYYPGFGLLHNPPPARGTLLSTYCQSVDKWGTYANGKFGTYTLLIKKDDTDCGWIPPSPPYGQILSYFCVGLDRWARKSDGNYGSYDELFSINSTSCGYTPPPTPSYTPATLNSTWVSGTTSVSESKLEALLDGSVSATNSVYSGKWYWEVLVDDPDIVVGIGLAAANNTQVVGDAVNTWGWSVSEQHLRHNDLAAGARPAYGEEVVTGDIVGVYLDFVAETLSFSINGVDQGVAFTALTDIYLPMFSDLNGPLPHVTVNFGQTPTVYAPPADFVRGYGVAASIRPRKGVIQSYYCVGTVRWARHADGNGGTYNQVFQVNSALCGYVPPIAAGTLLSKFCVGVAQWGRYADGNYGSYDEIIAERSEACGYLPAGRLISSECLGFDKWGTYSDGEFGTYTELMATNSAECGFGAGDGEGGVNPPAIDPNLPVTEQGGMVFTETPIDESGELIFIEPLVPAPTPSPHPAAGALLGTGCLDGWLCNVYATGGGDVFYSRVWEEHASCVGWYTAYEADMANGPPATFAAAGGYPIGVPGTLTYDAEKKAMFMPASNSYNSWSFLAWFNSALIPPSAHMRITTDIELVTPKGLSHRGFGFVWNWRDSVLYSVMAQVRSAYEQVTSAANTVFSVYTKNNNGFQSPNPTGTGNYVNAPNYIGRHKWFCSLLGDKVNNQKTIRMEQNDILVKELNTVAYLEYRSVIDAVAIFGTGEPMYIYKVKIETVQNHPQTFVAGTVPV